MTDSDAERIIDQMVQRRLERSNAYRNAASADEQAQVEARITEQAEADFYARYEGI